VVASFRILAATKLEEVVLPILSEQRLCAVTTLGNPNPE